MQRQCLAPDASVIERRYQLKIAESEFKNITTLSSVHRFVEEKLAARSEATKGK